VGFSHGLALLVVAFSQLLPCCSWLSCLKFWLAAGLGLPKIQASAILFDPCILPVCIARPHGACVMRGNDQMRRNSDQKCERILALPISGRRPVHKVPGHHTGLIVADVLIALSEAILWAEGV